MSRARRMTRPELDVVLDWAAAEGWNPGLDDADAFWAADPDGFFVMEEDGAPVAAISVVNHSDTFAFLGLYICRPSHRGRGIGYALWTHALDHAGTRTVGLDGVVAQQENYRRSGFVNAGATLRFVGNPSGAISGSVRAMLPADREAVVALEAAASGWEKPRYMRAWLDGTPSRRTYVMARDGICTGAATVRACREGAKIGPLVAGDVDEAWTLVAHLAATTGGPITIDVPAQAHAMVRRLESDGMEMTFETARMYRGPMATAPRGPSMIYGVGSLELG
ncbi:MAG: GNAT family N-acetyltransferase [Pseudomonadota bacterium]